MTVGCTSTPDKHGGVLTIEFSNGTFDWFIRKGILLPMGVMDLGYEEGGLPRLWVPDGWSGSAHDHWHADSFQAEACALAAATLDLALTEGIAKDRPWVTPLDRQHHPMLKVLITFLRECRGFETS